MSEIKVVVADDDDAMRQAMVDVLEAHGGFDVVGVLVDGRTLGQVVEETGPDVVLVDVRMDHGGVTAVTELLGLSSAPVVVAVSATTDTATVAALLRAGASSYLAKGHLGRTFPDDVLRCTEGQVVLAVPMAAQVLRLLAGSAPEGRDPLPRPQGRAGA